MLKRPDSQETISWCYSIKCRAMVLGLERKSRVTSWLRTRRVRAANSFRICAQLNRLEVLKY